MKFLTGVDPRWVTERLLEMGEQQVKQAGDSRAAYNLAGRLYLSPTGFLLLSVPSALVQGVFSAMHEPGIELPPSPGGKLEAHITVFRPEEVAAIGGAAKITERGKMFNYRLGGLYSLEPAGWPEMERVWCLSVSSQPLQVLRKSYGLSALPDEGRKRFHISVAVRRRRVLGDNPVSKVDAGAAGDLH